MTYTKIMLSQLALKLGPIIAVVLAVTNVAGATDVSWLTVIAIGVGPYVLVPAYWYLQGARGE